MKKFTNFALLIWLSLTAAGILMSGFALAGVNQWTSLGLDGATVTSVAIDPVSPETIYAGTPGLGIFKSIDGGGSWTDINNGLPYAYSAGKLLIDPINPATIYSGRRAVTYKSTDGGESWTAIEYPVIAIDPVTPTTLYAGFYDPTSQLKGIPSGYKSTDGGESWTVIVNDFEYPNLVALAIDPVDTSILYAADRSISPTIWGLFYGNVYKSSDGGESWLTINSGLPGYPAIILVIDPLTTTTLYASVEGYGRYGVYKSTDGGENWTVINNGLTFITSDGEIANSLVQALVINPNTPDTLYAGTAFQGVFKSIDGGESWTAINDGLTNLAVRALAINPSDPPMIYAGTEGGGVLLYEDYPDEVDGGDGGGGSQGGGHGGSG